MSVQTQESQIINLIIAKAKERTEIAGSVIGYAITRDFGVNMKSEYGGLKRFIRQHCAGEVEWVRKRGGDDIFSHVSNLDLAREISHDKEVSNYKEQRFENPWKVFNNPKIQRALLLNTTNGQLHVANTGEPIPENFILVEKITREENGQIARDFLAELDEDKRNEFSHVLSAFSIDDFWPHWSALLRKYRSDGILKRWLKWNDAKVRDLFESRLRKAQLPDNVVNEAVNTLKHSLEALVKPKPPYEPIERKRESINASLRDAIHAVIDRMSEEQLRLISLPIGLLSDELNRLNRKG